MRVLVVDDSDSFRDGLVSMLDAEPDVEVVGQAADGSDVPRLAARCQPDVVLMDLAMPVVDGIEATKRLAESAPHVGVVVLTLRDDDEAVLQALAAGARGYVVKGSRRAEVLWSLRAVAAGEAVFGPAVAGRMARLFALSRRPQEEFPELTEREREVLSLLARGRGNAQIARELGISDKTVRNHVSNVLTKLQAADRADAIVRARAAGLDR
jgi:DNA-binding NarL/FixJ family response regulator